MRWAMVALLSANLAYFAWSQSQADMPEPGSGVSRFSLGYEQPDVQSLNLLDATSDGPNEHGRQVTEAPSPAWPDPVQLSGEQQRKQAKLDAMDANDRTRMNIEKTKYEIDLKSFMRRLGEIPENVNTPHKLTEEEKATFRKFIELAKDSLRTIATKEKELTAKKWLTNAEINKLKQQYNFKQCLVKYENLQAVKNF